MYYIKTAPSLSSSPTLHGGISVLCCFCSDEMDPQTDKVVRRTTMVATAVASYFLLTGDYGPEPNVLDPIKRKILSAQDSVKQFFFPPKRDQSGKEQSDSAK